ncbi:MAG: hypothetical protein LBR98_00275 [Syntrophomonadaceae bacterium]|jgi:hypothetical protein|nr:hypothetical protein [Syntrophomonadaceae bacterium]
MGKAGNKTANKYLGIIDRSNEACKVAEGNAYTDKRKGVVLEMDISKSQARMLEKMLRQWRIEDKERENHMKPPLMSPDVLHTRDFSFSPIKSSHGIGDSGKLLLATRKSDRAERYLVKHEYCDCAVNEFVYTKLAHAMDIKTPEIKLFKISADEKRRCFKTEYVSAARFLHVTIENPLYSVIREQALNWQDFFRFAAMYEMFLESDSFEILLAGQYIYRIDVVDAFPYNDYTLRMAGVNKSMGTDNPQKAIRHEMLSRSYNDCWQAGKFEQRLQKLISNYGSVCETPFLEPFLRIQAVPNEYIDNFLHTLCYFYPDFIGDYFKLFIAALRRESAEYLATKK